MTTAQGRSRAAATVLVGSTVATAFKLSPRHLAPAELLLLASLVSLLALPCQRPET